MASGQSKAFLRAMRKKYGLGEFRTRPVQNRTVPKQTPSGYKKVRDRATSRNIAMSYGKHYWQDPFYQQYGFLE